MDNLKEHLIPLGRGALVERDVLGIVEAITEYDPNLYVQFCDPALAEVGDAPYRIMERCRDGIDRVAFYTWSLDGTVLDRIRLADTQRLDVIGEIEKKNQAAKRETIRRYQDRQEVERDIVKHIVSSHKVDYTFPRPSDGAVVKVFSDRPSEVLKGGSQ
jgi:hypothetical protein